MKVAFRAALPADFDGFFELGDCLVPIARARGRKREVAERIGSLGDAALLLQIHKALLIRFCCGRIDLAQVARQIVERLGMFRIELRGFFPLRNGVRILAELGQVLAKQIMRGGILRIEDNDLPQEFSRAGSCFSVTASR